jgi:hypothetical protein
MAEAPNDDQQPHHAGSVGAQLPSFETANHLAEAMIISASSSTWPKSGQIAITDDYLEAEPEGGISNVPAVDEPAWVEGLIIYQ